MKRLFAVLAAVSAIAVLVPASFYAAWVPFATAPLLGTTQQFAVLAASTVTNTGPTVVTGDLGLTGTSVTGFPPGLVIGTQYVNNAVATLAQSDAVTAYNGMTQPSTSLAAELGGQTLTPDAYDLPPSALLTGQLVLNAEGDPAAVWIFLVPDTITTAVDSSILLINGAQPCNVFWQVGSSATIGVRSKFIGTVIAMASVTFNTGATLAGRAIARTGAVTLDTNVITATACAVPPAPKIPPTVAKSFSQPTVTSPTTSTLTITITNPDPTVATLTSPLVDTLPSGMTTVAGTATTTCTPGTLVQQSLNSVTLPAGFSIPANSSCTVAVEVEAAPGTYVNSIPIGALVTSNGNSPGPAVATLVVLPTPTTQGVVTVNKAFNPASVPVNAISTLTITLSNTGTGIVAAPTPLVDSLPAGVFTVPGTASTTCTGSVGQTPTSVTLTGASLAGNSSCTVTVQVLAPIAGTYLNVIANAVVTLTVTAVPQGVTKVFDPSTIYAGGTSTVTITFTNPTGAPILIPPFIDYLPTGLIVVGTPTTTCGGTITATTGSVPTPPTLTTSGSSSSGGSGSGGYGGGTNTPVIWKIILEGGEIPAADSCTITFTVKAKKAGTYTNLTPPAVLIVLPPPAAPTVEKSFSPSSVTIGTPSLLTITLRNSNSAPATLTAPLVDNLPGSLKVNGVATTTCGGIVTAVLGSSQVTLAAGNVIPATGSCTVTVNVVADKKGSYCNTLSAGALQTNLGKNKHDASATLTVPGNVAPKLSKSFLTPTIKAGGVSMLVLTLTNQNSAPAVLTAPLKDTFPNGLQVFGTSAGTTCAGGVITATPGTGKVIMTGGTIPANGSCTITVLVTAANKGSYCNTLSAGALQTTLGKNQSQASATLTVKKP